MTNEAENAGAQPEEGAAKPAPRPRKQRGPPEDGIPSKTKVMVANLPYDLSEEKVRITNFLISSHVLIFYGYSSRNFSLPMSPFPPRSLSALSPAT